MTATEAKKIIEDSARENFAAAVKQFPQGCEDSELRAFLNKGKYGKIAYELAWGRTKEADRLIAIEVSRYGK